MLIRKKNMGDILGRRSNTYTVGIHVKKKNGAFRKFKESNIAGILGTPRGTGKDGAGEMDIAIS